MTRLDALRALLEQVEAGTERPEDVAKAFGVTPWNKWPYHKATTSLDAAKALHEAVLPGWLVQSIYQFEAGDWLVTLACPQGDDWPKWTAYPYQQGKDGDKPARAWLIAIIRALIAEAGE